MTREEQLVWDALTTMGIPFWSLSWSDAARIDAPCVICGKPRADFGLYRSASGDRAFHIECLPSMRGPKMTKPFVFDYLRSARVDEQVEKEARLRAQNRETLLRLYLFDVRDAINKLMRAIE